MKALFFSLVKLLKKIIIHVIKAFLAFAKSYVQK